MKRQLARVGLGYDIHRLMPGRALVLGGVRIRSSRGLLGHSDADVVLHAVCDALLGAAGCEDIGEQFPPTDQAYKDISSLCLLERTVRIIAARGYEVGNVDIVIIAETVRVSPYKERMKRAIARVIKTTPDAVGVKATTPEGVGALGRGEAIAAHAIAQLVRPVKASRTKKRRPMMCLFSLLVMTAIAGVLGVIVISIVFRGEIAATMERGPAATSFIEIVLTYPGLHALILYRIARRLRMMGLPLVPRMVSQAARFVTGIEIHPGARIGTGLFIDHGMGVVIGETTVIGTNVTLYQGVTLGGTGKEKGKRHPTIGNNVVVGSGAKVLGNIVIGDNARIGANAVVVRDVPPNATVVGVPGRIARQDGKVYPGINLDHTSLPDPIAQALDRLQQEIDHIESELKDHREE